MTSRKSLLGKKIGMKRIIKYFCMILALALTLGCLTCCASKTSSESETEDPSKCTYTVNVTSLEDGKGIEGVMINFCTDYACTPVTTDEDGTAVFTGDPYKYHVQIIKCPEGFEMPEESDWYTEEKTETYNIKLAAVNA